MNRGEQSDVISVPQGIILSEVMLLLVTFTCFWWRHALWPAYNHHFAMNKSEVYTLFFFLTFIGEEIPSMSDSSWNLFRSLLQHQEKWEIINKFMKCAELRLSPARSLLSRVVASYPPGPVSANCFIARQLLRVKTRKPLWFNRWEMETRRQAIDSAGDYFLF